MSSRLLFWSLTFAVVVAGGVSAYKQGLLNGWKMRLADMLAQPGTEYSDAKFRIDLIDQCNYVRLAAKQSPLRVDPELEDWLERAAPTLNTDNLNQLTEKVQAGVPRYMHVEVCCASSPSLRDLLQRFQDFTRKAPAAMSHMAVLLRPRASGLMQEALLVMGQRLQDFSPEALSQSAAGPYFSVCVHCQQPHYITLADGQRSVSLECPKCRRKYAVIAADRTGKFRYVNEYLTGYAPPAHFARNQSRVQQMFTIWEAVHNNCHYTNDPGAKPGSSFATKEQVDSWQFADETQRLLRGDCEDSSIFLADWLMSRGFQVRVALGRYGDLGGHAWCVVKIEDKEYLLESTDNRPDPTDPPLASRIGSRYVPEVLFDRHAIYVPSSPTRAWKGDYWSSNYWTRIEPRAHVGGDPILARAPLEGEVVKTNPKLSLGQGGLTPPLRTSPGAGLLSGKTAGLFLDLGDIPPGATEWTQPTTVPHP